MQSPNHPGGIQSPHRPGNMRSPNHPGNMRSPHRPGNMQIPHRPGNMQSPNHPGNMQSPNHPGNMQSPNHPGNMRSPHRPGNMRNPHRPGNMQSPHHPGNMQSPSNPRNMRSPHRPGNMRSPHRPGNMQSSHHPGNMQSPSNPGNMRSPHRPGNMRSPHRPGNMQSPHHPGNMQSPSNPGNMRSPHRPGNMRSPHRPGNMQSPHHPGNMQSPSNPGNMRSPHRPGNMQSPHRPGNMQSSNSPGSAPGSSGSSMTPAFGPVRNNETVPDQRWRRGESTGCNDPLNGNESPNKRAKPSEEQPPLQSNSVEKQMINGDDSSDEESEKTQRSSSLIRQLYSTSSKVSDNMQCSFISLYLGIRILMSKNVAKLYYSLKREKLSYTVDIPSDQTLQEDFKKKLKNAIERMSSQGNDRDEFEVIQNSQLYSSYLQNITQNKEHFVCSPLSRRFRNPKFENSYEELRSKLAQSTNYCTVQNLVNGYRNMCAARRPVLESGSLFLIEETAYSPAKFLANLRLDHCSTKRSLKNINSRNTTIITKLVREWKFGTDSDFFVIENQKISSNGQDIPGVISQVSTKNIKDLDSGDYESLFKKLETLRQEKRMTNAKIVRNIRSLLKTGKLENSYDALEEFLTCFTYLLFGLETVRHPASLIYNVLALDLIENFDMQFNLDLFPMTQKGAVGSARAIQDELSEVLKPLDYHYDYKSGWHDKKLEEFQEREKYLIGTWINWKFQISDAKLDDWLKCKCSPLCQLQFTQEVNQLCKDYYDIDLL